MGMVVEKVPMNGAVIVIPKPIVNHFKNNKDTKIDWKINVSNIRYRHVEVKFSKVYWDKHFIHIYIIFNHVIYSFILKSKLLIGLSIEIINK